MGRVAVAQSTILIVDDDAAFRQLLRAALEEEGFGVIVAATCDDALQLSGAIRLNAVVLDLRMPGMSPLMFAREVERRAGASIPMIIVSALPRADIDFA